MRWTNEQDDVIRELGHRGVLVVRRELIRRCRALHSIHAIEQRACRIHASLKIRSVCPGCGVIGAHMNRQTKMCPMCSERLRLEEERAFNEILEREREEAEGGERIEEMQRERATLRQRNSRLCRKYGLKTKAQRKREQSDCEGDYCD